MITGAIAFAIVAVVLTTSELLAGGSATGEGRTTLFGGSSAADGDGDGAVTEPPAATPAATPTPLPTPEATTTPQPTPTATPTPEPTPTPES